MTQENLSSLEETTPAPTPEPEKTIWGKMLDIANAPETKASMETPANNVVKVPLTDVLNALRARRTSLVNQRKVEQKRKRPVEWITQEIHKLDAQMSLLEAGPKNQSFLIPLREAHNWGFGMMPNGRWPKL